MVASRDAFRHRIRGLSSQRAGRRRQRPLMRWRKASLLATIAKGWFCHSLALGRLLIDPGSGVNPESRVYPYPVEKTQLVKSPVAVEKVVLGNFNSEIRS